MANPFLKPIEYKTFRLEKKPGLSTSKEWLEEQLKELIYTGTAKNINKLEDGKYTVDVATGFTDVFRTIIARYYTVLVEV